MLHFPAPKINPKKLSQKDWKDLLQWKGYSLIFNRVTKDDRDNNLDSNVILEVSLYVRPKYDINLTQFSDLIDLLLDTRKETTIFYSDLPDRFLGHYFDELTIYPLGRIPQEWPTTYGNIFMPNWKRNFLAVDEIEIDINLSNDPRESGKDSIFLPNAFDLEDHRFRNILDCFQIYNELAPQHSLSRGHAIYFYKRLNYLKNELFDIANPEDVFEYNALDANGKGPHTVREERHRYWIPSKDISLKNSARKKAPRIIGVFNENWKLLEDLENSYKSAGHFRDHSSAATNYLREILKTYGHFLRKYEIASFCLNCECYFHYKKGKKFCSLSTDGRNCGKIYRNQMDYIKHRDSRKKRSLDQMRAYRQLLHEKGVRK